MTNTCVPHPNCSLGASFFCVCVKTLSRGFTCPYYWDLRVLIVWVFRIRLKHHVHHKASQQNNSNNNRNHIYYNKSPITKHHKHHNKTSQIITTHLLQEIPHHKSSQAKSHITKHHKHHNRTSQIITTQVTSKTKMQQNMNTLAGNITNNQIITSYITIIRCRQ